MEISLKSKLNKFEEACFGTGPVDLRTTSRWWARVINRRKEAHPGLYECGVLRLPGLETFALMRVRDREQLLLRQGYITQEDDDNLVAKDSERRARHGV